MSEAQGEWVDLLQESAMEASRAQASVKPASVPEPAVKLPQRTFVCVGSVVLLIQWARVDSVGSLVDSVGRASVG